MQKRRLHLAPSFGIACSVIAAVAATKPALAADYSWNVEDGLFTTDTNWDPVGVPTVVDDAFVNNGGTAVIQSGDEVELGRLRIDDGVVNQTGGSLDVFGIDNGPWAIYVGPTEGLTGTLNISGDSSVTGARVRIGDFGGTGSINLSGNASFLGLPGNITRIAASAGSTGTLSVTEQAQWITDDWMIVGSGGNATLNVAGELIGENTASVIVTGNLYVGEGGSSEGTVDVSGTGRLSAGETHIGRGGLGHLTVKDDAELTTARLVIGNQGGTADATFQDNVSVFASELWVGDEANSKGTLNISGTSNVTVNSWVVIGRRTSEGKMVLEGDATFVKTGGDNFSVGNGHEGPASNGELTIRGNAHLDVQSGELWIAAEGNSTTVGVMNLEGGTVDTNSWVSVGRNHGAGTLNISGGTFNFKATGSYTNGVDGNGVAEGQFFTSEGSATANAVINQSGGVFNNVNSETWLAEQPGSVAVWNATGGTSNHKVIRLGVHNDTNGTLNISGTAVVNARMVSVSSDTGSSGTLNLNGGRLVTEGIVKGNGTGSVHFNGGTLVAAADSVDFIAGFEEEQVIIESGGLVVDTSGFDVEITLGLVGEGNLAKIGEGTLILSGLNAYIGDTAILDGVLSITTGFLADSSNVSIRDGSIFDLNFTGTDTINALVINGEVQPIGTYGRPGSGADFELAVFSGDGILEVTSVVIPEPQNLGVVGLAALGLVFALRRRRTTENS